MTKKHMNEPSEEINSYPSQLQCQLPEWVFLEHKTGLPEDKTNIGNV
jgi:hypothetical protein